MKQYGILINGQLIVHRSIKAGDKEIVYTDPPEIADDEISWVSYEEQSGKIVQIWHIEKSPYEPIEPTDISDSEALEILLGGAVE